MSVIENPNIAAGAYQDTLALADLQKTKIDSAVKQAMGQIFTTMKIEDLYQKLDVKREEVIEKAEKEMEIAQKKAKEAEKKAKGKRPKFLGIKLGKDFTKGLKIISKGIPDPWISAAIAGTATGIEAKHRKKTYAGYHKDLSKIAHLLKDKNIKFGPSWTGQTRGFRWLEEPTKQTEKSIADYLGTGVKHFESGAEELKSLAADIDPFKSALIDSLTTLAMKHLEDSEDKTFFQNLKESFVPSKPDDWAKMAPTQKQKWKREATGDVLKNLAMFGSIFSDEYTIPEVADYSPNVYGERY
jgi:uncharacterized membrane-anchored protein YhcB (DUF1043 family)